MTERVWLRHTETGGYWECPAGAVDEWSAMGWVPAGDAPEEHNPVIAEMVAPQPAAEPAEPPEPSREEGGTETTSHGVIDG